MSTLSPFSKPGCQILCAPADSKVFLTSCNEFDSSITSRPKHQSNLSHFSPQGHRVVSSCLECRTFCFTFLRKWEPGSIARHCQASTLCYWAFAMSLYSHLFQMIFFLHPYYCCLYKSDHFYFTSYTAEGNKYQQVP